MTRSVRAALGKGRRAVSSAERIGRHPDRWREELELARLEAGRPFQGGESMLLGVPIRYTHPQSLAVQYRTIFQDQAYRFSSGRPDPVIVDCGANIGLATIYWKRLYPRARVVAYEPDPVIAEVLRANLAATGLSDVEVVEAAVWTEATELSFRQQGAGGGRLGEGELRVSSVRLADRLEGSVDLLKVDIEGAEVDVMLDCAPALAQVERAFVEFHSFADRPQRFHELVTLLAESGYRLSLQCEHCAAVPFIERPVSDGMDMQVNLYAFRDQEGR